MSCQSDKRFQCRGELWITIRGDTDEYAPVIRDWVRLYGLIDNLGKVACEEEVVLSNDGVDPV